MKKILDSLRLREMLSYMGYGKSLTYISIAAMVVTYICHKIFKKQRWVKYLPGFIMVVFGLYSLTKVDVSVTNFLKDNSLTSFITGIAGGLSTLLFGLILGVFNKQKKVGKPKEREI